MVYLGIEVKCPKDEVVAIEAQPVNARHLALIVVVPQYQNEYRCTA